MHAHRTRHRWHLSLVYHFLCSFFINLSHRHPHGVQVCRTLFLMIMPFLRHMQVVAGGCLNVVGSLIRIGGADPDLFWVTFLGRQSFPSCVRFRSHEYSKSILTRPICARLCPSIHTRSTTKALCNLVCMFVPHRLLKGHSHLQNRFGRKQRSLATSIGLAANQLGAALGFFLAPFIAFPATK